MHLRRRGYVITLKSLLERGINFTSSAVGLTQHDEFWSLTGLSHAVIGVLKNKNKKTIIFVQLDWRTSNSAVVPRGCF